MRFSSRIEEAIGRKTYIILFQKEKTKDIKYAKYEKHNIVCKLLKVKI